MKATLLSSDGVLGTLIEAPVINLSNRLRVVNFSSPHPFNFVDGSVLPACDAERSKVLSMDRKDAETPWTGPLNLVRGGIVAVKPVFVLTYVVMKALADLQESWDVDLIIVPFPLLQALAAGGHLDASKGDWPAMTKVGTVIMEDRITKAAAIDKFGR